MFYKGVLVADTVGFPSRAGYSRWRRRGRLCKDEVATPRPIAIRDLQCGVAAAHAPGPNLNSQRAPSRGVLYNERVSE